MSGRGIHAALRVAFAILGLAAIAYQMLDLAGKGTLDPVNFFSYTMIRGALTDRYPYPFLDPANGGYGAVAMYSAAILVGTLLAIGAIMWAGNAIGARSRTEA